MYTEEEIMRLEEEEHSLSEEELLFLLAALHTTLDEIQKELQLFYQKYGKDGVVTYSEVKKWVSSTNHTKRLFFLNTTISNIVEAGFDNFEKSFVSHLEDIIAKEAQYFNVDIDEDEILNALWGADGSNWSQRLLAHRTKWTAQINIDLKLSFLKRDSVSDVIRQMVKRGESMEKILTRLWRTESNAISSLSRQRIYETLGIKKYRFVHIDGCHCEVCSDMDNRVFPVSEYEVGVTANPLHPNCRDITVPIQN